MRSYPFPVRVRTLAWIGALVAHVAVTPKLVTAQYEISAPLLEHYIAWDEGRYVDAIEGYLELLGNVEADPDDPAAPGDGAPLVREIARLTGELHPVRKLDEDGLGLAISPDGTHYLWRRPEAGSWVTVVMSADAVEVARLPSGVAAFSGAGEVAYLSRAETGVATGADVEIRIRFLATGVERTVPLDGLQPLELAFAPDGSDLYMTAGMVGEGDRMVLFRMTPEDSVPAPLSVGEGHASGPIPVPGGRHLVFSRPAESRLEASPGTAPTIQPNPGLGILDLLTGRWATLSGSSPSVAADGSFLAYLDADGDGGSHDPAVRSTGFRVLGLPLDDSAVPISGVPEPRVLLESPHPLQGPAVSPSGEQVAFELRADVDWEIFLVPTDGSGEITRITREVQHDRFPAWLSEERLLAKKGESRHRRAYVYELNGSRLFGPGVAPDPGGSHRDAELPHGYRLFHNNTLRTIAPEYEWVPHPEGAGVLVAAQRDGDTIAQEWGVFWVDLTGRVTLEELVVRLEEALDAERDLLERGRSAFAPVAFEASAVADAVSVARIGHYASVLYAFGSKFVTQPGNASAIEFLSSTLEEWGYEVELQWFDVAGVTTANVVASLPGTRDPDLTYVVSSHFDSVLGSPGADDNSSGTTALLEVARVLRDYPRAATIQFAFLTAEEAGLLGAREFVRRAVDERKWIAGVLNNDMVGWTRSHRLDNTIRYSHEGIRDIQHAAAHYFSDLITYDARYTRGTDAAVFYEAYGDIVGGIGSYPVLGNPNYHQATDQLHTVNHRLVAEVSRTTAAAVMLLADSPMPVEGLHEEGRGAGRIELAWLPSVESGVAGYRVVGDRGGGVWQEVGVVRNPQVRISMVEGFTRVRVRAIRDDGTEGWGWSSIEL